MNYKIKPEFLHLWGFDATEESTVSDKDVSYLSNSWGIPEHELKKQLVPVGEWYAVQRDREDDWGTGSFDLEEARHMAREQIADYPDTMIAVIENDVCIEEITDFGETVFSGYDPEGKPCKAVLDGGRLYIDYGRGTEDPFNEEWYDDDFDFLFMLIHEGFRRG